MLQKISRGDVYYYNFGQVFRGSIEGKRRPCVVVSNDMGNTHGTTCIVAPITTREASSCKSWQVHFNNNGKSQIILLEQLRAVNIDDLDNYQGRLNASTMKAVDVALAIELDLDTTDRELNSIEFLEKLESVLSKTVKSHLSNYDKKINEIISNAISASNFYKHEYEKLSDSIVKKITSTFNGTDINNGISEIKSLFNKNSENLDKILSSLINLYKDINVSKDSSIDVHATLQKTSVEELKTETDGNVNEFVSKNETDVKNEVKLSRPRYTIDYAKEFIKDYYNMQRQSFMSKYGLTDTIMVNNRLITMKKVLKRAGIDWRNIKDNIIVYNINDLSEEEKQTKFAKYLKKNETLAVVNKDGITPKEVITEISETVDNCSNVQNEEETNTRKRKKWQPRINYNNVQELLDFVKECNENSITYICNKYELTQKQLSNRKYLISKSLKERNIPFTMIKKSRKDV